MSLLDNSYMGGIAITTSIRSERENSTPTRKFDGIANGHLSDTDKAIHQTLDILESEPANYATLAIGAGLSVAGKATLPFAISYFAAMGGAKVGTSLGHYLAPKLGFSAIKTESDIPIYAGDWVMHKANRWEIGGMLAGVLIGAVAIFATVATGGLAATLFIAGTGGFLAGLCSAAGSALGQYGEKKGEVLEESCSPDVFFEGQRVARVGDIISCEEHPWTPPPVIAEGVANVFANGRRIARVGHQTQCDGYLDINPQNHRNRIQVSESTVTEYQVVPAIGAWTRAGIYLLGILPLGKQKGRQAPKNERPKKPKSEVKASEEASIPAKETQSTQKNQANETENLQCCSDPVDIATGDFLQQWEMISLPQATLPIQLTRLYRSRSTHHGFFGDKWADTWSQSLHLSPDSVQFCNENGVEYWFYTPENQVNAINLYAGHYHLFGNRQTQLFILNRRTQQILTFSPQPIFNLDNTHWYLSQLSDRFNNKLQFEYNKNGLSQLTHSDGFQLKVRSENGLIVQVDYVSEHYNQTLLQCDYQDNQLVFVHSHQFGQLSHRYNKQGFMLHWADSDKTSAEVRYDEKGRVIEISGAESRYNDRFYYDDTARCTQYHDAEGGISYYWYNDDYLITKSQDALGRITENEWDFAYKVSETDALGQKTQYRYNNYGELEEVQFPTGKSAHYCYNARGQLIEFTDKYGETYQYFYGEQGELLRAIQPNGLSQRFRYNAYGVCIREEFADGQYWQYRFDEQQRQIIAITNPKGEVSDVQHDIFGRLQRLERPDGSTYRYEYSTAQANPKGSLTAVYSPEGNVTSYQYNSEALLTAQTDGNGFTTSYGYGAFDLLQWQESPQGERLSFHYDKLTRLTQVQNAEGDCYVYQYDKAGQLIQETDFAGNTIYYAYDKLGRLHDKTQGRGKAQTQERYTYDNEDRLILRQTWQADEKTSQKTTALLENFNTLAHQIAYQYNEFGQLIRTENHQLLPFESKAITEFEYDDNHWLIAEIQNGERIEIERDRFGRQTQRRLPHNPTQPQSAVTIQQVFNHVGELTEWQFNHHQPLTFQYDKLGRQIEKRSQAGFYLAERFTPSGLLQAQGGGYDNELTQQQLRYYDSTVPYPISGTQISRKWEYDKAQHLIAQNDRTWGRTEYRHNRNGQVEQTFGSFYDERCRYDSQQNLTHKTKTEQIEQFERVEKHSPQWQIKQHHGRVVRQHNTTFHYDSHGRLTEKWDIRAGFRPQKTIYRWNSQHQLVEFISPNTGKWRYEYDSFGRRLRKYQLDNRQYQAEPKIITLDWVKAKLNHEHIIQPKQPCQATRFIYHGNQLVAEIPQALSSEESPTPNDQAHWLDDWQQAIYWLYQNETDFSPIACYQQGELFYTATDHIGTVTDLISERGYIEYQQHLSLWGETDVKLNRTHNAKNEPLTCQLRFAGQYADKESGLYYNRYRYYSPSVGQYISPDPIGLLGGFNPYGYVGLPTEWVDPLGLSRYDGVSFAGSPYLYPVGEGQKNIVKIQMQGSRYYDFKEANIQAGFGNTADSHPSGYTWHHRKDFDPVTNATTLELVKTPAHRATFPHAGSPAEFGEYHGVKYDTPEARGIAQNKNNQIAKNQNNVKC